MRTLRFVLVSPLFSPTAPPSLCLPPSFVPPSLWSQAASFLQHSSAVKPNWSVPSPLLQEGTARRTGAKVSMPGDGASPLPGALRSSSLPGKVVLRTSPLTAPSCVRHPCSAPATAGTCSSGVSRHFLFLFIFALHSSSPLVETIY